MHLKVGVVAVIVAAAAGAAAGRATAPHVANATGAAAATAARTPAGPAFVTSDAVASEAGAGGESDPARARSRGAGAGSLRAEGARAVVYVAGAVTRPGVYAVRASARADDALRAAGGATAAADLVAINLAARVEDGEEIAVPLKGAGAPVATGANFQPKKHARRHAGKRGHRRKRQPDDTVAASDTSPSADAPTEMVDVNAADEATLETLPGVGPSLAQRIVAFRNLNGPFASTDELLDVGGMTAGKVDALSPYVLFH
jgi:competence protein ComEA